MKNKTAFASVINEAQPATKARVRKIAITAATATVTAVVTGIEGTIAGIVWGLERYEDAIGWVHDVTH